jgi:hypothetical protein
MLDLAAWRIRIRSSTPMSLQPQEPSSAPEETCRIARGAFPKGTLCLRRKRARRDLHALSMPPPPALTAVNCWSRSTPPKISHGWRSCPRCKFCGGSGRINTLRMRGSCVGGPKRKCQHPQSRCPRHTIRPLDTVKSETSSGRLQGPSHRDLRPEMPRIVTNVETTPASTPDDNMLAPVHQSLEQRARLPPSISSTRATRTRMCWSTASNSTTSALSVPLPTIQAGRPVRTMASPNLIFLVDWDRQVVTCPAGILVATEHLA